jgi:NAD(P)-dependent dehydrogenase (short-subunit alcohol dehydrogenase family)
MSERRPRLDGKVAIVTGGGSSGPGMGNGKAMCILFAREGGRVLIVDRDFDAARETAALVAAEGGEALPLRADVTSDADCAAMVRAAVERWGGLHILVNNVGIGGQLASVVDADAAQWDRVFEVNVKGMMLASKHAIPALAATPTATNRAIVNIASVSALRQNERAAYSASKGAVISLTMVMAGQHARQGIRVNCVCPGQAWTPMVMAEARDEAARERLRERRRLMSLLKTEGEPWDIANAVLFFASDEAKWITGQTLVVDGGLTIGRPPAVE